MIEQEAFNEVCDTHGLDVAKAELVWNACREYMRNKQAEPVALPYAYVYEFDSVVFGTHRSFSPSKWNGIEPSRSVAVYTHPAPSVAQEPVGVVDRCEFVAARNEWRSVFYTPNAIPAGTNIYTEAPAVAQPIKELEFGMAGGKMFFGIGVQRFTLDYEPELTEDFEFMKKALTDAINSITHGVKTAPAVDLTNLVNRFLGWKLPLDFAPDCGISIDTEIAGRNGWPSGTNLFNAEQAKQMFEYVTQGTPTVTHFSNAYHGAREDLAIWKKRALEAEELNRKFIADINGQTFMGEPAPAVAQEPVGFRYKTRSIKYPENGWSGWHFQEGVPANYHLTDDGNFEFLTRLLYDHSTPDVALTEVLRELVEALNDFSNYVHAEQSSTDGHVQYSNTQIIRLAFKARSALKSAKEHGL